jgi:putative nucleotidyltransferase with HDIG domain
MTDDRHDPRETHSGDALLRAVSRATASATTVLDPELIAAHAADAAVRFLGARRADVWRFEGRRAIHVAASGPGGDAPGQIPASLMRVARGGLAHALRARELGAGCGLAWQRMLFSIDSDELAIHSLVIGERTLGAITIVPDGDQSSQLTEAQTIFSQHIAAAIEKAELHQAAQDAALAMRIQNRVLTELTDERDIASLRTAVEHLVTDVLSAAAVALLPIDTVGRVTIPSRANDGSANVRIATAPEMEYIAPALETADALELRRPDLRTIAALGLTAAASIEEPDGWSMWGIQLRSGDRPTGVLLLATATDQGSGNDARIAEALHSLAPAVAIALDNAQMFARQHLRAGRLAAANVLASTVTQCSSREELYEAVVSGVRRLFGFTRVSMYDALLRPLADAGVRPQARAAERERGLVSTSMHRRRASRIERPDRTCHAIPLLGSEVINAVVYAEQPDTVTPEQEEDDLGLLVAVCEHAAACLVAIEATSKIERNYMDTIQALVHALEARDQYTADHSDAVAEWALACGRRLGMDDSDLRDLELASILHDIGKVAVPDGILNKAGRLTEEEFEVMKSHTVIGERILQPIGFLERVAPIVRHEHERWDGRGYPDGVAGEDIPLSSRIIFVCDAYHAITSDRPYRKGQTHEFARRIVTENAGSQFDPAVVSVFMAVIEQWYIDNDVAFEDGTEGEEIVNPMGKISKPSESDGEAAAAA